MQSFAYFPALVYRDERPDLLDVVFPSALKELETAKANSPFITQTDNLTKNLSFQDLSNYLLISSVDILKSQGYATDRYDFYLSALWAQEVNKGGGTNVHVHKNSQICGWYFLDVPENGAYPAYYDTRANKCMVELNFHQGDEIINATNTVYFGNIINGTVLFSNSWMNHQLLPGKSELPTRCIHFIVSHRDRLCNIC